MATKPIIHKDDLEKILNDIVNKLMDGKAYKNQFSEGKKTLGTRAGGYMTRVEIDKNSVVVSIKDMYTFVPKISATYLIKSQQLVGLNYELLGDYVKSLIIIAKMGENSEQVG